MILLKNPDYHIFDPNQKPENMGKNDIEEILTGYAFTTLDHLVLMNYEKYEFLEENQKKFQMIIF